MNIRIRHARTCRFNDMTSERGSAFNFAQPPLIRTSPHRTKYEYVVPSGRTAACGVLEGWVPAMISSGAPRRRIA